MQLHFVGRNIDVTPALKEFTTQKFHALEKRHQQISHVHVTFHIENLTHTAEATVHMHGNELHATAKEDDMYKAIEVLADKLLTQITKMKDKIIDSHR